jgi:isochorismate synthase
MNTSSSVSTATRSETEILHFLLNYALDNELPIAIWRLPNTAIHYLLISQQSLKLERGATIEDLAPGFMFAPFDREMSSLFLPADFIFSFENQNLREGQTPKEVASAEWLTEKLHASPRLVHAPLKSDAFFQSPPAVDFLELVAKSTEAVQQGIFEKVVPSRTKLVDLPADFDVVKCFEKLCANYPLALVSFVSIPGTGHWLGATPEALVSVEDKNIFKTVALAGTMPYQPGMNLRTVAWTQKEIEEQALVERYVISCFKKIRVREYDEHGPKTVVAGNLVHLKSDFTVDMKAINFPQLGSVMLELLHPTSAVCGAPLAPALGFLKTHEGYDREFYSGYLGPVNIGRNIDLFVNLRCMKLTHDKAILYAGAGVTYDSVPEKEWEETEMKFKTLLNVIG